jgi:hypothetical protein
LDLYSKSFDRAPLGVSRIFRKTVIAAKVCKGPRESFGKYLSLHSSHLLQKLWSSMRNDAASYTVLEDKMSGSKGLSLLKFTIRQRSSNGNPSRLVLLAILILGAGKR